MKSYRIAQKFFALLPRSVWAIFCICSLVLFCTACGEANTMFTVIEAALATAGVIVTGLGALISPSESAMIEGAVTAIGDLVQAIQAAFDAYEADPSGPGLLAALEAAVTSLQANIPTIMAALHITNPTLQAWITTIVGLVGKLAEAIAADIIPKLAQASASHAAGDDEPAKVLAIKFKALTTHFIADVDLRLADSGLPPKVITTTHDKFHHEIKFHIGPLSF
jgi:hypothetical protein